MESYCFHYLLLTGWIVGVAAPELLVAAESL